jgi:acetolactate synthase-1/2/3 large subunit
MVTAARQCVEALVSAGVTHAFMVPGESFLELIDELDAEPSITLVTARHEGGAAFMAEGFAKASGRPSVCMGTRVVGAANLAIGLHTALQDSSPVIALLGQVATDRRHTEGFQEVELGDFLRQITKWAVEPADAAGMGEAVWRAAWRSTSGRRGPTAVALREDTLRTEVADRAFGPVRHADPHPDPAAVAHLHHLLATAERPVLLVGGATGGEHAAAISVAEQMEVPVLTAWRRPDAFPNDHRLYLGQPGLARPASVRAVLEEATLIVAIGARLSDITTDDYTAISPRCEVVLVHPEPAPPAGTYDRTSTVTASPAVLLRALAALAPTGAPDHTVLAERRERNVVARARWEADTTPVDHPRPGFVDQHLLARELRSRRPAHSIVVNDAGNFSGWVARYQRWTRPFTYLGPTSGAMGYALPAAIGARLAHPDSPVIAIAGDGGFLMTGVELETAVRHGVALGVLVVDNANYGTIRMHQDRHGSAATATSALGPVDIAGFARSLGADAITVTGDDQVAEAIDALVSATRPLVVDVKVDPGQNHVNQA